MLHHWRATVFVAGARADDLTGLLTDLAAYPRIYAPQVLSASAQTLSPTHLTTLMRVRQHHVITVTLDTSYDFTLSRTGTAASRSTRIDEIDSHGQPIPDAKSQGFLWRQNTYWHWAPREGGLLIEVESLSLTRAIPTGLGWASAPSSRACPASPSSSPSTPPQTPSVRDNQWSHR